MRIYIQSVEIFNHLDNLTFRGGNYMYSLYVYTVFKKNFI